MKRNYSLPKMNSIEITNRLNRLKARNKPRLQFPMPLQSRKHFFDYNYDNVKFIHQNAEISKSNRRDKLDISDIEGARPKKIQKEKNVLKYYQNKKEVYNPFLPLTGLPRSYSEHQTKANDKYNLDALDKFQREIQRKLAPNPQTKRQLTEPSCLLKNFIQRKEGKVSNNLNINNSTANKIPSERKNLLFNPTYMSSLVLL